MNETKLKESIFPTPTGLFRDTGPIGQFLRQLPRTVLEESEKQDNPWTYLSKWVLTHSVEWLYGTKTGFDGQDTINAECAKLEREGFKRTDMGVYTANAAARRKSKIREVRFYFHKDDSNKRVKRVIMDGLWPDSFRKTFEAAASQRNAIIHLVKVSRGGGSIFTKPHLKIQAAQMRGDHKTANHWADKLAASILRWESGRQWLLEDKHRPPKLRKEARRRYELFYAADVRRLGRKKADEKWKGGQRMDPKTTPFKLETASDKVAATMAMGWLALGRNGFPGFSFISDASLATVLGLILNLRGLKWKTVRTIRERVGLKKAEILVTGVKEVGEGKWAVLNHRRKEVGWFDAASKRLPPKL